MRRRRVTLFFQKFLAKTMTVRGRSRPRLPVVWVEGAGAANGSVAVKMRLSAPTRAHSEVEEERVFQEWAASGALGFEGDQVFERPAARAPRGVGRGEDVGVVGDRDAASRRRAAEAGDLNRAVGVGLGEATSSGRVGRGNDVAAGVSGGAEGRGDTGDREEVAGRRRADRAPGGGAAGRIARDEDPPFFGDGDAERGSGAGDATEVGVAADLGPPPDLQSRIGRSENSACRPPVSSGHRDAERR
jgi:hypothetical protein